MFSDRFTVLFSVDDINEIPGQSLNEKKAI